MIDPDEDDEPECLTCGKVECRCDYDYEQYRERQLEEKWERENDSNAK